MIAVESDSPTTTARRRSSLLNGLVEPLGVAIDNARWFARLRTIGADEERSRIARDLHDHLGQSLAYLGFELDRAVRAPKRSDEFQPCSTTCATRCARVVQEVRETLYDLRTDVSDDQDVGTTMEHFLRPGPRAQRPRDRAPARARHGRLPLLQEKELWRIAKEAVINAERHAKASAARHPLDVRRPSRRAGRRRRRRGLRQERRSHRFLRHPGHARAGYQPRSHASRSIPLVAQGTTVRVALDPRVTPRGGRP